MPLMPSDVPQYLEAALKVIFFEELANLKPDYQRICTTINTTQETQDYGWIGSPPAIREFIDERVGKGLAVSGLKVTDKTWEATIAISRRMLENDQLGAVKMRIQELAQRMVQGVDELAFTVLGNSANNTYGYSFDNYDKDGTLRGTSVTMSDDSHTYPEPAEYTGTQDNYDTDALAEDDLFAAYTAMMSWKDDRGKIIPHKPDLLVTGPTNHMTALQILTPMTYAIAAAAGYVNVAPTLGLDLLITPYFNSTNIASGEDSWALCRTSGTMKPLILQLFTPAANGQLFEFTALEGNSDNGFMRDTYYYGIRGRWNIAYGDWRNIYFNLVA